MTAYYHTTYAKQSNGDTHSYVSVEVEPRKVQRLGYSSLGVSLPKDWAKASGVEPGTTVLVVKEDDGTLRIRTGEPPASTVGEECALDADSCSRPGALRRLLIGSYVVGRNSIRVKSRTGLSSEHLREIQETAKSLTGLTIVNQGPKFVLIENFAEPTRFPIDGLLRRLQYLTSRMGHLSLQALRGHGAHEVSEVHRLEDEADRLYWLATRQLLLAARDRTVAAKIGVTEPRHLLGDRVVAITLESIADLWEEVARGVESLETAGFRPTSGFADTVARLDTALASLADASMTAFFATSLGDANSALDVAPSVGAQVDALRVQAPSQRCERGLDVCTSCLLVGEVVRPIGQIVRQYGTVAQLTMNRALELDRDTFGLG